MTASISTSQQGHVAEIRFSSPPLNFVSAGLLAQIADAVEGFDGDPAIRCTVLIAEGKAFCAGADLAGDESIAGSPEMDGVIRLYEQAKRLFARKKPIVAAIQGAAIGAGLGLAVAADFRVAAPEARFSANFVRLGFHPGFALTHTLPALIGAQHARWMMLSGERVKPDDALAWGLVDKLASADGLIAAAHAMAAQVAENAPLALVDVRATLSRGLNESVAAALEHEYARQAILRATEDYAEGVASVFERRDAAFKGR